MIHASIRNYCGMKTAELDIDGLTLIAGLNAQGKSSTLAALAAALVGAVGKDKGPEFVSDGAEAGMVSVTGPGGARTIRFPKGEVDASGRPPIASPIACGQVSLATMSDTDRATALIKLLKAAPTLADLTAEFKAAGIESMTAAVWGKIESIDWDGAHAVAVERGKALKGAWKEITREQYGSIKAASWAPSGFRPALEFNSEAELNFALEEAQSKTESAAVSQAVKAAVSASERERHAESAARLPELQAAHVAAGAALLVAESVLEAATAEVKALPEPGETGAPCPHCGEAVLMRKDIKGELILSKASVDHTIAARDAMRSAISHAEGREAKAAGERGNALRAVATAGAAIDAAKAAAAWLEANPAPVETVGGDDAQTEAARVAVANAQTDLDLWTLRKRAAGRHKEISENQLAIDILAPTGIRQTKLRDALAEFNLRLAQLTGGASWPVVVVTPELAISWGLRPYHRLSVSEAWRVRFVLQVACAELDGSEVIIADGADVLMMDQRNALFSGICLDIRIPVVIGVSVSQPSPAAVPDLAAHGLGNSYWIEAGLACPISVLPKRSAA